MDSYRVKNGKVIKETICALPGGESNASEWCKEYCPFYGRGFCRWDSDTNRMMIKWY
jgi:hypothetical protein